MHFPFGYGLSYTTFEYQHLAAKKSDDPKYPAAVTVTLKNTGSLTGKEVVQVYALNRDNTVGEPPQRLAGYTKVELAPGEACTVEVPLCRLAFQHYDVLDKAWKLVPGECQLRAGTSSRSLPIQVSLKF